MTQDNNKVDEGVSVIRRRKERREQKSTTNRSNRILESLRVWLTAGGLIVSAVALVCAAYGINEQHTWNRRHFAVEMIREWNNQSSSHKAAIENAYPQLFRDEGPQQSRPRISNDEARRIYFSTKDEEIKKKDEDSLKNTSGDPTKTVDPTRWETRNHCIALLNYFEFVASAWENQVADRKMVEDSFKKTILRWHHDLEEFMNVMKTTRGYEPWPPLQRVVTKWKADDEQLKEAPPTGAFGGK
ncbi:MAG: hypothetical protein QOF62_1431 [Pyrinomonadaceae bacterium]|nr:hypothetical protein [Pyrinomonadaceae bacterium]